MSKDTIVLGIYGKKGSGKDTVANHIKTRCYDLIHPVKGVHPSLSPVVKIYHFADAIKEFCVDYLSLDRKLLYGDDNDKNTVSHITWGQMPHYLKIVAHNEFTGQPIPKEREAMTYRQIMQHVGTEWFEPIEKLIWIRKVFDQIEHDVCHYALIADVRFPKEIDYIKEHGHKCLKLTRNIAKGKDLHKSEIAADNYEGFDYIIDNENMTLDETLDGVDEVMDKLGWTQPMM